LAELEALPPGLRSKLLKLMRLVEEAGLEEIGFPHVRHLDGKLWELRAKAEEGIARGLYVTVTGRRVVIVHVFQKKTQETPLKALAIARARAKEVR
jgi:phage-related protein